MHYKNLDELKKDDPQAVSDQHGATYLERPVDGWFKVGSDGFGGIGDHGSETGFFNEKYKKCIKTGHMPPGGYG